LLLLFGIFIISNMQIFTLSPPSIYPAAAQAAARFQPGNSPAAEGAVEPRTGSSLRKAVEQPKNAEAAGI
jgi:hypothetical protein